MQRVRVNATFSEYSYLDHGVPQGSVLGPEIYNYTSNDLFLFIAQVEEVVEIGLVDHTCARQDPDVARTTFSFLR